MSPRLVVTNTTHHIIHSRVKAIIIALHVRGSWKYALIGLTLTFDLVDEDEVVGHASKEGSGDRSLFSSALGYLNQNKVRQVDYEH